MKIKYFEDLEKIKLDFPNSSIVHCHGVFDLFHFGHLQHLRSAKKYGELLIVTLTPDQFVNKGPNRPYNNQDKRAEIISSLEIVDFVCQL